MPKSPSTIQRRNYPHICHSTFLLKNVHDYIWNSLLAYLRFKPERNNAGQEKRKLGEKKMKLNADIVKMYSNGGGGGRGGSLILLAAAANCANNASTFRKISILNYVIIIHTYCIVYNKETPPRRHYTWCPSRSVQMKFIPPRRWCLYLDNFRVEWKMEFSWVENKWHQLVAQTQGFCKNGNEKWERRKYSCIKYV